jgi:hypothetical protein
MPISDYLEVKLTQHTLGKVAFTMPTTLYVALYTSDPGDDNTGTEVTGTNYVRLAIAPAGWTIATGSALANNVNPVLFETAGSPWGTISHMGILDALTAGNLLWHGPLVTPRTVNTGDTIEWPAGTLNVGFQ